VKGHFVEVTYRDQKGKLETARGYIRNIEAERFHIRNGLWRADIAYRDVVMLVMGEKARAVDRLNRQVAEQKAAEKAAEAATDRLIEKTVKQMRRGEIDRSVLKENQYVLVTSPFKVV